MQLLFGLALKKKKSETGGLFEWKKNTIIIQFLQ